MLQVQIIDGPLDEALGEVLGHVRRVDLCADVGRVDGGLLAAQLTRHHRRPGQQVRLLLAPLRTSSCTTIYLFKNVQSLFALSNGEMTSKKLCCGPGLFIQDPNLFHSGSRIRIKFFYVF